MIPQPLPTQYTPWPACAHCKAVSGLNLPRWIAKRMRDRAEVGHAIYGTYLGVGNPGRNAERDLEEELLDALGYAWERWLATGESRYRAIALLQVRALGLMDGEE